MCGVVQQLEPFVGYVLTGSCGERLEVGVSEVLEESRLPESACAEFRRRALAAFGPGGGRSLVREEVYDPALDPPLGRPMRGTLQQELAELADEQRRWGL